MPANSLGEFRIILSRIKDLEKRTENVNCTLIKNDLEKINETISVADDSFFRNTLKMQVQVFVPLTEVRLVFLCNPHIVVKILSSMGKKT